MNINFLVQIFLISIACVNSNPVHLDSRVAEESEVAKKEHDNANKFEAAAEKGNSVYQAANNFINDNAKESVNAKDNQQYGEEAHNKKNNVEENKYADEKYHNRAEDTLMDIGKKVAHKKGHHKSGFRNSYYKDESGSNSSFYDDGEDAGDELIRTYAKGNYGDSSQAARQGGNLDSSLYANDLSKKGYANEAKDHAKAYGDNRQYDEKNYFNNNENLQQHNNQHEGAAAAANQYKKQIHEILPPHPPPLPGDARKIIIYEDPRLFNRGNTPYKAPPYDDRNSRLEVRPPPNNYYDYESRPYYDYYY